MCTRQSHTLRADRTELKYLEKSYKIACLIAILPSFISGAKSCAAFLLLSINISVYNVNRVSIVFIYVVLFLPLNLHERKDTT